MPLEQGVPKVSPPSEATYALTLGTARAEGVTIHFKPNEYNPIVFINREHIRCLLLVNLCQKENLKILKLK
jgi:hypothetical protein